MASQRTETTGVTASVDRTRWWGFWLYAAASVLHVAAISFDLTAIVYPTKLTLMPLLAVAAGWYLFRTRILTSRGSEGGTVRTTVLLLLAIAFSWLGDGAAFFFPMLDDELPAMLLCFGVAHLLYIWLFARRIGVYRIPVWTLVYAAWWGIMIAVLWPHLGALLIPVMIYGLVLGGTAVASTRGGTLTAIGGAFFLASDTILALRLFLPGISGELTSPWVMLTYTLGQGLLVAGVVRHLREQRP